MDLMQIPRNHCQVIQEHFQADADLNKHAKCAARTPKIGRTNYSENKWTHTAHASSAPMKHALILAK